MRSICLLQLVMATGNTLQIVRASKTASTQCEDNSWYSVISIGLLYMYAYGWIFYYPFSNPLLLITSRFRKRQKCSKHISMYWSEPKLCCHKSVMSLERRIKRTYSVLTLIKRA